MELHSLQEALKVEIQCHQKLVAQMKQDPQNGELKKQIHERQSRITALSEKQKLAVRSCPVGNTKPIPLIKAPNQSIAISVVPAKNPVTMVTAHINGQKAASTEPPQTAPINLQTTNKLVGSSLNSVGRKVAEISNSQTLGAITAVPIKVPQVSSLQRLAGQGPTVLPQVKPVHRLHFSFSVWRCVFVFCCLLFVVVFVIIIQPQIQTPSESKAEKTKKTLDGPAQGPASTRKKKEDNPEKIAFMVALGLVTTEHLEEIQSKRQERKRRSTANPAYSGLFEPERKRLASNCVNNPLFLTARANEDLCWKDEIVHDEHCTACKRGGQLQPCDTCPRAYHLECLDPPLKTASKGFWVCPKCQQKVLKKEDSMAWPGTLTIVHSYIAHKAVKEEEKRKLLKRGSELKNEHKQLEEKDRLLSNAMMKYTDLKNSLLARQKGTQSSLQRLKSLIRLIQSEQMIQVTMTTTTTSSLLTIPWIKPSSAPTTMQKPLQQSQGNN
nr:PREDICTED: PHD finger protein 21B [Latimeria chalumnae]|eukprot:XP_014342535.1 PREDICTED: PHD finger protein 21B [Latimeria chalumnae]